MRPVLVAVLGGLVGGALVYVGLFGWRAARLRYIGAKHAELVAEQTAVDYMASRFGLTQERIARLQAMATLLARR